MISVMLIMAAACCIIMVSLLSMTCVGFRLLPIRKFTTTNNNIEGRSNNRDIFILTNIDGKDEERVVTSSSSPVSPFLETTRKNNNSQSRKNHPKRLFKIIVPKIRQKKKLNLNSIDDELDVSLKDDEEEEQQQQANADDVLTKRQMKIQERQEKRMLQQRERQLRQEERKVNRKRKQRIKQEHVDNRNTNNMRRWPGSKLFRSTANSSVSTMIDGCDNDNDDISSFASNDRTIDIDPVVFVNSTATSSKAFISGTTNTCTNIENNSATTTTTTTTSRIPLVSSIMNFTTLSPRFVSPITTNVSNDNDDNILPSSKIPVNASRSFSPNSNMTTTSRNSSTAMNEQDEEVPPAGWKKNTFVDSINDNAENILLLSLKPALDSIATSTISESMNEHEDEEEELPHDWNADNSSGSFKNNPLKRIKKRLSRGGEGNKQTKGRVSFKTEYKAEREIMLDNQSMDNVTVTQNIPAKTMKQLFVQYMTQPIEQYGLMSFNDNDDDGDDASGAKCLSNSTRTRRWIVRKLRPEEEEPYNNMQHGRLGPNDSSTTSSIGNKFRLAVPLQSLVGEDFTPVIDLEIYRVQDVDVAQPRRRPLRRWKQKEPGHEIKVRSLRVSLLSKDDEVKKLMEDMSDDIEEGPGFQVQASTSAKHTFEEAIGEALSWVRKKNEEHSEWFQTWIQPIQPHIEFQGTITWADGGYQNDNGVHVNRYGNPPEGTARIKIEATVVTSLTVWSQIPENFRFAVKTLLKSVGHQGVKFGLKMALRQLLNQVEKDFRRWSDSGGNQLLILNDEKPTKLEEEK